MYWCVDFCRSTLSSTSLFFSGGATAVAVVKMVTVIVQLVMMMVAGAVEGVVEVVNADARESVRR